MINYEMCINDNEIKRQKKMGKSTIRILLQKSYQTIYYENYVTNIIRYTTVKKWLFDCASKKWEWTM